MVFGFMRLLFDDDLMECLQLSVDLKLDEVKARCNRQVMKVNTLYIFAIALAHIFHGSQYDLAFLVQDGQVDFRNRV